jgi:putative endonuclease
MPFLSRAIFRLVHWAARKGLRDDTDTDQPKHAARRTGIQGELDLVGYDGETLAFVEVRTRTLREDLTALPELSLTTDKQRVVARTAQRFLAERHVSNRPCRFVLAIDNHPGHSPAVRLTEDAFSPQL